MGVAIGLFINASDLDNTEAPNQIIREELRAKAHDRRVYGTISAIAGGMLLIGGVVQSIRNPQPKRTESVSLLVGHRWVGLAGRF